MLAGINKILQCAPEFNCFEIQIKENKAGPHVQMVSSCWKATWVNMVMYLDKGLT
jgi:hypothetical protein